MQRSAGAPGAQRAGLEAEQGGRPRAHRLDEADQRHVAGMDEAQRDGEHRLQPHRAVGGLGEGLALALHVLRIVRRAHDVDRAVGHAPPPWRGRSSSERSGGDILKKVR